MPFCTSSSCIIARRTDPARTRAPASVKIPRTGAQAAEHGAEILHVLGNEVSHAVDLFPPPAHRQQAGTEQRLTSALGYMLPDHDIDHTVLVLQGHKDSAACRLRP